MTAAVLASTAVTVGQVIRRHYHKAIMFALGMNLPAIIHYCWK